MIECNSIDNTNLTYYQKNQDVIINTAKDYYENDKERIREQARNKEKNKKKIIQKSRYLNMSEEKKKSLKEQKNYCEAKKI